MKLDVAMTILYAAEINCGLSSFWDGGWDVWVGDEINGVRERANFRPGDMGQIGDWLIATAKRHYPMFAMMDYAPAAKDAGVLETAALLARIFKESQ